MFVSPLRLTKGGLGKSKALARYLVTQSCKGILSFGFGFGLGLRFGLRMFFGLSLFFLGLGLFSYMALIQGMQKIAF